jgi:hypothetical protein
MNPIPLPPKGTSQMEYKVWGWFSQISPGEREKFGHSFYIVLIPFVTREGEVQGGRRCRSHCSQPCFLIPSSPFLVLFLRSCFLWFCSLWNLGFRIGAPRPTWCWGKTIKGIPFISSSGFSFLPLEALRGNRVTGPLSQQRAQFNYSWLTRLIIHIFYQQLTYAVLIGAKFRSEHGRS